MPCIPVIRRTERIDSEMNVLKHPGICRIVIIPAPCCPLIVDILKRRSVRTFKNLEVLQIIAVCQQPGPYLFRIKNATGESSRRIILLSIDIKHQRDIQLLYIIETLNGSGFIPRLAQCGQKHTCKNRNDRNYDEELYQGEISSFSIQIKPSPSPAFHNGPPSFNIIPANQNFIRFSMTIFRFLSDASNYSNICHMEIISL